MTTQPETSLFRQQALDARGTRFNGSIVLAQPVPTRVATVTAVGITTALTLLLAFGHYTRKVHTTGSLAPVAGSVRVLASQLARVTRRLVADDQQVRAGQPLIELSAERNGDRGSLDGEIESQLAARLHAREQSSDLQADELRLRASALAQRRRTIDVELATRQRALALQDQLIQNASDKEHRYSSLATQGFVSAAAMSDVSAELAAQRARREELKGNLLASQRDLLTLDEEAHGIDLKLQQVASLTRQDAASLRQEAAEHEGRTHIRVTAPIAGTVSALAPDVGQTVNAGAPLVTILPTGSALEARLMVPAQAITFVESGQQVRMHLEGVPHQKFGPVLGVVQHIDRSPAASGDTGVLYRVTVRLDRQSVTLYGREKQFVDGMPLEADIMQDRRRLFEWLIDPLISAVKDRAS